MGIEEWISLGIVFACLMISAFFSGAETALTAASRARMLAMENNGDARAAMVNRLLKLRDRLIGTLLIGNNIVNTAAASLTTAVLLSVFGDVGIAYATVIVSVMVIIFSEVLPKTVAINSPDNVALRVSRPVALIMWLFTPLTVTLDRIIRFLLRITGLATTPGQNVLSASEELRGTVDLLHREGSVEKTDRDMLGGLLNLKELQVLDVMVHRTKMMTIDAALSNEEIVRQVLASPYTRIPLWRDTPENIVGILHSKDLLRALQNTGVDKLKVMDIASTPWFIPDTTQIDEQLKAFRRRKAHVALVVDEYGEVQGLVTLEDIIEEIVGDISDEHDIALTGVRPQPDGSVNVDGSVHIRDLNRAMDWNLPDEEATTIAGLVIHEARTIPEAGQAFTFHGFRFHVMRKQRNRIMALRITPVARLT